MNNKFTISSSKEQKKLIIMGLLLSISLLLSACGDQQSNPPVVIQGTAVPPLPTLDNAQFARGEINYAQFCAECHGTKLEGESDWQRRKEDGNYPSPPLDSSGHAWHHTDDQLMDIIANGGNPSLGATMEGFSEDLSENEMVEILEFIKSHWGREEREFQWWITVR
jgi:cytochrome c553